MPKAYAELERIRQTLEKHFKDVQDFEFTIEEGVVYMLQTRNGKRTAMAALKFSIDMYKEKLIDWKTAVMRNPADQLEQLLAPVFDAAEVAKVKVIATGLPAGPGAASGQIYFNADRAVVAADKGEKVLLVRVETSPEDLRGMIAAEGILTARGGVSSHAALVARQMGKVCVCGAAAVEVDYQARTVTVEGKKFKEGEWMSIDGTVGHVYAGQVKTAPSEIVAGLINGDAAAQKTEKFKNFQQLMKWCSDASRMSVRTNADTPEQTANAVAFGAVGIGLTRTEHMFFEGDRIDAMREMILAETVEARKAALAKLLPYQREDFAGIFRALKGYPATIRFLDPPLHEFLPHAKEQQEALAKKIGVPAARIHQRVEQLHEFNPMLGFRGCRLGIGYPEISAMQARAVFEAAAEVQKEGIKVRPEIMIPLVAFKRELDLQIEVVHQAAREVQAEKKVKLNYMVGTMIEIPRGALTADEIAQSAEFFSFGTNDLTQTGLGMSRDDSGSFLPQYQELEIVTKNPFATIDATGVGQLVEIAVTKGRAARPNLKLGICGEHGGDPASIRFFEKVGLDYVSCSPYRVPVARLAAAQAALQSKVRLITIHKHERGSTQIVDRVDPAWLRPGSGVWVWVDLSAPTPEEARVLTDVFHFHELAVEDAIAEIHHPKVESYGDYLYLILHGIDFKAREHAFRTQEIDFFLGAQYLVTFHNGTSRSIGHIGEICGRNEYVLGEGPAALLYRIVDTMVDNYRPEVDKLGNRLDMLEKEVFARPKSTLVKRILDFKRDVSSLRRVIMPERDAVAPPRPPRVLADLRGPVVQVPRRARSPRAPVRRGGLLPGPHLEPARRAPVERLEPAERRDEGADDHLDHLHADDRAHRDVRDERAAAASARWGGRRLLVDTGDHGLGDSGHAHVLQATRVVVRQSAVGSRGSGVAVGGLSRSSESAVAHTTLLRPTGTPDWD